MRIWVTGLGVMLASLNVAAQAPVKIAVLPTAFEKSAEGKVPGLFNEYLNTAVQNLGFEVIGQDDISALVNFEEQKDLLGCDDATCFADIGSALGVDKLVHVKVAHLETDWVVTAKLINIRETRVDARATKMIPGDVKALLQGVEGLIRELFGEPGRAAATAKPTTKPTPEPNAEVVAKVEKPEASAEPKQRRVLLSAALATDLMRGEFGFSPWVEAAFRLAGGLMLGVGVTYPINIVPTVRYMFVRGAVDIGLVLAAPMLIDDGFEVALAGGATAAKTIGDSGLSIVVNIFVNYDLQDEELTLPVTLGAAFGF